jgi:uracil-DNA glycosylase
MTPLAQTLKEIRACTICAPHLPHGVRPVVQMGRGARILVAGQAPGRRVHESGLPFDDPSGDRLREWMGVDRDTFYDPERLAIVPMGFCYPGTGSSGDLPPRPECAPAWRERALKELKNVELTIVLGKYALEYHLGRKDSVTAAVEAWRETWPTCVPLPHPSPRNRRWISSRPWFERELLPELRRRVREVLG